MTDPRPAAGAPVVSPRGVTVESVRDDPEVRQFVRGEPDGPVKFHYPAPEIATDFGVAP